jgi:hypothetical protein
MAISENHKCLRITSSPQRPLLAATGLCALAEYREVEWIEKRSLFRSRYPGRSVGLRMFLVAGEAAEAAAAVP